MYNYAELANMAIFICTALLHICTALAYFR